MENLCIEKWKEPYAPNATVLRRQLEREGYRVFHLTDSAGTIYALHTHSRAQSHWIISGAMEFIVEDESYILEAGDRDFLPANVYHSAQAIGEESVVYLVGEKINN